MNKILVKQVQELAEYVRENREQNNKTTDYLNQKVLDRQAIFAEELTDQNLHIKSMWKRIRTIEARYDRLLQHLSTPVALPKLAPIESRSSMSVTAAQQKTSQILTYLIPQCF